jgi:DeoR/GlpR family transcriptional regulator of sugar metabolism
MTTFERRQRLVRLLQEQAGIKVTELAGLLGVSHGTIRNDLTALEEEGLLTRVRGGAALLQQYRFLNRSFAGRAQNNAAAKQRIACCAARLVEDGAAILLDASTTVFAMIPYLNVRRGLTIVTNGIEAALALAPNPSNTVILIGGVVRTDGTSVVGHLGAKILEDLHFKTAFVSCSGFSIEAGLTEVDIQEVQTKKRMIRSAEKLVALIDSSKFGRVDLTSFAGLEQVSHIFTDGDVAPAFVEALGRSGIQVTVCSQEAVSPTAPCGEGEKSPVSTP